MTGRDRQTVADMAVEHSGSAEAVIDITAFEGDAEVREENGVPCVYTPDGSYVTWKVNVEQAGMYNIQLDYLTTASRGVDIERELYINGELPFSGARSLCRFSSCAVFTGCMYPVRSMRPSPAPVPALAPCVSVNTLQCCFLHSSVSARFFTLPEIIPEERRAGFVERRMHPAV